MEDDMRTKPHAIATTLLTVALGMVLCAPLAGCSGCNTDRGSTTIQNISDGGSNEKGSTKATAKQGDAKTDTDADEVQGAAASVAEAQRNGNGGSSATPQAGSDKTASNKSSEPKDNDSQPAQSEKKWVPEQGHWETEYGEVWVPNIVYTRHERYWVNHGGTNIGPFNSKAAAWAWCDNDVENGGIGGSVIDDSYTTTEDQGHYERQAAGQHWVVDTAGHWE